MASIDTIIEDFELLDDWEDRYRYLIELGRELEPLPDAAHNETNKVRGCASQVWLVRDAAMGGRLHWRGDSDAHIVRGLIAVTLQLFNGRLAQEILTFDAKAGLTKLGLTEALSTQRSNGLFSMIERIRRDARDHA